ncbi:MAG: hypothetical protein Kow00121_54410 [Elainellaceae cyanobacterium]
MGSSLDEFVDEILTDIADADYAASPAQLRQNQRAGRAAQERLGRALAQRGYRTRQEIRLRPSQRRLDVVAQRGVQPGFIYESKHIDLARYLTPQGTLDQSRLRSVLQRHIAQVRRYQTDPALIRLNRLRQQRSLPSVRVRLVYQVPPNTPPEQAIEFQRFMLSVLSPQGIAGTVIMPGSPASRSGRVPRQLVQYVDLSRYLTPQGALDEARLHAKLRGHIDQVRRYQNSPAIVRLNRLRQRQNLSPMQIRLVYHIPRATPRGRAIAFQQFVHRVLATQGISGTVMMPP